MFFRCIAAACLCVMMFAPSLVSAGQQTTKLPGPIDTAFKESYPSATIKAISKEKYHGKAAYEVESIDKGKARDLIYLADGTVVVIEEEISAAELPAQVAAALAKDAAKSSTVSRYERAVENGIVSYEVQFKGGRSLEYTAAGHRK